MLTYIVIIVNKKVSYEINYYFIQINIDFE